MVFEKLKTLIFRHVMLGDRFFSQTILFENFLPLVFLTPTIEAMGFSKFVLEMVFSFWLLLMSFEKFISSGISIIVLISHARIPNVYHWIPASSLR